MRFFLTTLFSLCCFIVFAQPIKVLPAALFSKGKNQVKTSLYIPGKNEILVISHQKGWIYSTKGELLRGPYILRQDGGDAWYPRVSDNGKYITYYMPGAGYLSDNDRVALFDTDSNYVTGVYELPMSSEILRTRFAGDSILLVYSRLMEFDAIALWLTRNGRMKTATLANDSVPSGVYDFAYYEKHIVAAGRYADSLTLVCAQGPEKEHYTNIILKDPGVKCHVQISKQYPYVLIGDESRNDTRIFKKIDTTFSEVAKLPSLPVIHAAAGSPETCYIIYEDTLLRPHKMVLYNSTKNEEILLPFPHLIRSDFQMEIYPERKVFTASHPTDGTIRAYSLETGLPVWVTEPLIPSTEEKTESKASEDNSLFRVMIKQGSENVTASWLDAQANQLLLVKDNNKLITVDAESKCAVRFEQFYKDKGRVVDVKMVPGNRHIVYTEEKWEIDEDDSDNRDWKKTLYQYPYSYKVYDRQQSKPVFELQAREPQGIYIISDSLIAWAANGYLTETDSLRVYDLYTGRTTTVQPAPGRAINKLKATRYDGHTYFMAVSYDDQLIVSNDEGKELFTTPVIDVMFEEATFVKQSPYVYIKTQNKGEQNRLYKLTMDSLAGIRTFPKNIDILASSANSSGCYFLTRWTAKRKTGSVYQFRMFEMLSGKIQFIDSTDNSEGSFGDFELHPEQGYYLNNTLNIFTWHDLNTGTAFREFGRNGPTITSLVYSPDGRYLAAANPRGKVLLWDLGTGKETKTLTVGREGYITRLAFSGDGKYLAAASGDIWETATGKNVVSVTDRSIWDVNSIDFSIDGKRIISGGACIISWDAEDGSKLVYQQRPGREDMDTTKLCWNPNGCVSADYALMVQSTAFHPNSRDFVTGNRGGIVQLWNTETKKMSEYRVLEYVPGQPDRDVYDIRFTRDGKYIIAVQRRMIYRMDASTLKVLDSLLLPENDQVLAIDMGFADNQFGCITSRMNSRLLQIRDLSSLQLLREFKADGANFNKVTFSPNGKHAATSSEDGFCTIWDLHTGEPAVYLSTIGEYGNIMVTKDNYYMASKSALEGVTFFREGNFYSFDQFDLYLNRPDIVLGRLGYASPELVNFYRNAYYKRLKKSTGKVEDSIPATSIPGLNLLNRKSIPPVTRSGKLNMQLVVTDSLSTSGFVRISVNGNLVSELPVLNTDNNMVNLSDSVVLGQGTNNIEAVYRSSSGLESHKQKLIINYNPAKKEIPKTWFIGIGVSKYADKSMDLKYPVKDVRDLAAAFKKKYPGLIIDTLLDGNATREKILAIRDKLMQTSVNDRVIISFNGHGLLSDSLDWYFGTHDIDAAKPAMRGLAYTDMENILQGIPARQKLLLMDACHSGEVDRESDITISNQATDMDNTVVATNRGLIKNKGGVGLQTSFELMQEMFANLNNGNGATVLSAAGGMEYALESDTWKNGVFTYSILQALRDPATDENSNTKISVKELKKAVFDKVKTLTGGRQKPTSRVEVLDDWEIW